MLDIIEKSCHSVITRERPFAQAESETMTEYNDRLADYVYVAERIQTFREKHPEGSLQPANPANPYDIIHIGEKTFIVYVAAAYRTPDDPRPGIGIAYEPFPGLTPYTKNSELMVAETSAWGRAIVASLAADSKKIASRDEVVNRQTQPTTSSERTERPQSVQNTQTVRMATDGQERTLYAISKALDKLPPAKGSLTFAEASAMIDKLKEEQQRREATEEEPF